MLLPKLEYAAPQRRVPRTYFIWVLLALGPLVFYSAFTGYCYLAYGHRPRPYEPKADPLHEVLLSVALFLLLASPIGAMLCGLRCGRLGSWPRRLVAGLVIALVVVAANYCLYTVDPYGVTEWMRD